MLPGGEPNWAEPWQSNLQVPGAGGRGCDYGPRSRDGEQIAERAWTDSEVHMAAALLHEMRQDS